MTAHLPAPRTPGRYAVGLVCLGNICRSPTADVVLSAKVAEAGLADRVEVGSCGTGGWHVGEPMDERAAATLRSAGYDPSRHRGRQHDAAWAARFDVVLAMDAANLADLGGPGADGTGEGRVMLFGDLDPVAPGSEVPDPYYGGADGFEEVLEMVERTSDAIVDALPAVLDGSGPSGHHAETGA